MCWWQCDDVCDGGGVRLLLLVVSGCLCGGDVPYLSLQRGCVLGTAEGRLFVVTTQEVSTALEAV